jgi:RNA recognition motif-containing protein
MAKNIYVGNLPWNTSEEELREAFAPYGDIISAKIITDRETGRSRGFGFVEIDGEGADEAIRALDGSMFGGRTLKVNEARPRPQRQSRW